MFTGSQIGGVHIWIQHYSMLVATPNNMLCTRNLQLCDPFIPLVFFNSFDVRLQVEEDDLDLCETLSTALTVALQFIVLSTDGLAGLSSADCSSSMPETSQLFD